MRRPIPLRFLTATLATGLIVAGGFFAAPTAHAADADIVDTAVELRAALTGCAGTAAVPTAIRLGTDIDDAGGGYSVECVAEIDLAGHGWKMHNITVAEGEQLTLIDSIGSGLADVDASGYTLPVDVRGASLVLRGASLTATADYSAAVVDIGRGSLLVGAGSLLAASSARQHAITGNDAELHIEDGGVVNVNAGTPYRQAVQLVDSSELRIEGALSIGLGVLTLPADAPVVITETGVLLGRWETPTIGGKLAISTRIENNGAIQLEEALLRLAVTGHNYGVDFRSGGDTTTVRAYATTMQLGYREIPAAPALYAWNTAPDGSGTWFTETTPLTGDLTVYAVEYDTMLFADMTATAGDSVDLVTTVLGGGIPLDPQPLVIFSSADPGVVINGSRVSAERAGEHEITASTIVDGDSLTATATFTVSPGALDELTLTASATSVDVGGSLGFFVDGTDAFGNTVDATGAVLTSDVATDVIDGLSVLFPTASPHTITATLNGISAAIVIEVIPAAAPAPAIAATGAEIDGLVGWSAAFLLIGGLAVVGAQLLNRLNYRGYGRAPSRLR